MHNIDAGSAPDTLTDGTRSLQPQSANVPASDSNACNAFRIFTYFGNIS